jgi:hypothetical protein
VGVGGRGGDGGNTALPAAARGPFLFYPLEWGKEAARSARGDGNRPFKSYVAFIFLPLVSVMGSCYAVQVKEGKRPSHGPFPPFLTS